MANLKYSLLIIRKETPKASLESKLSEKILKNVLKVKILNVTLACSLIKPRVLFQKQRHDSFHSEKNTILERICAHNYISIHGQHKGRERRTLARFAMG